MVFIRPDPNEELRLLEEKAAATYGVYKEKCDTKVGLLSGYLYVLFCGSLFGDEIILSDINIVVCER